ncbi:MAG: hypothetical protein ACR2HF_16255 [Methylococcaceae bacterium]
MTTLNPYHQGIHDYHAARLPDEPDLVAWMRDRLIHLGLLPEVEQYFDTHHYVQDARDKNPRVQRFLLNQYWNLQLMACPAISINERYCLIYQGEITDWQRLMDDTIFPFAQRNRLPMTLSHER